MIVRATTSGGGGSGCRVIIDGEEVPFSNPLNTSGCVQFSVIGLKSQGNFTSISLNVVNEFVSYKLHNGIDADSSDYNHIMNGNYTLSQSSGLDDITFYDNEAKPWGSAVFKNISFS